MNKGGRPRLLTLAELRQQASLEVQNKNNGGKAINSVGVLASNNLKELREMLKLQNLRRGRQSCLNPASPRKEE